MHDRRHGRDDRDGPRHEGCHHEHGEPGEGRHHRGGDEWCRHEDGSRHECHGEHHGEHHNQRSASRGEGPDTRFLQLEISQVLYAEAESLTRDAFRALLLEAAKARLRERFGDKVIGLAQLAVDELMADALASLDIEARIQHRNRERARTKDRLRDIFAAPEAGSPRREDDGGEGGGEPGGGHGEDR